jgi:hypothetical protein
MILEDEPSTLVSLRGEFHEPPPKHTGPWRPVRRPRPLAWIDPAAIRSLSGEPSMIPTTLHKRRTAQATMPIYSWGKP